MHIFMTGFRTKRPEMQFLYFDPEICAMKTNYQAYLIGNFAGNAIKLLAFL